jgi:hypothetical protein
LSTNLGLLVHGNVEILAFSQFPKFEVSLRSWVPDWKGDIDVGRVPGAIKDNNFYHTGCNRGSSVTVTSDPNMITLRATLVDTVKRAWTPFRVQPESDGTFDYLHLDAFLTAVKDFCKDSDSTGGRESFRSPKQRAEAIWRIPIRDLKIMRGLGHCRAPESMIQGYNTLQEDLSLCKDPRYVYAMSKRLGLPSVYSATEFEDFESFDETTERRNKNRHGMIDYLASMDYSKGRCPFITQTGYVGLGPANIYVGDKVYVVLGSAVPYVLRQTANEKH